MSKTTIFWIVGVLALLFNLFSLYDLVMTTVDPASHLADYPPAFVDMILDMPEWRRILWTTTVFLGVIGAGLLLLRRAMAERALWATALFLAAGIVADYAMLGGAAAYGTAGAIVNVMIVAIEAGFALYAGQARRQGLLR